MPKPDCDKCTDKCQDCKCGDNCKCSSGGSCGDKCGCKSGGQCKCDPCHCK